MSSVQHSPPQPPADQLPSPSPVEMAQLHRLSPEPSSSSPPPRISTDLSPDASLTAHRLFQHVHDESTPAPKAEQSGPVVSEVTTKSPATTGVTEQEHARAGGPTATAALATVQDADAPAIGPHMDSPIAATVAQGKDPAEPAVNITLLLTTGARHPYRIDRRYLIKREVPGASDADCNPFEISIYTMKELIWRDWREDWETRPKDPSAIRLIHFGKLLEDKTTLKDARFQQTTPNVVHMTVKPQELDDEDDHAGGKGAKGAYRGRGRDGDNEERGGMCRCCIM